MKIVYSRHLEKHLSDSRSIFRKYGKLADSILMVLSVIQVSDSLADLPPAKPTRRHKLKGDYDGCWAIDLNVNYRMIIKPIKENYRDDLKDVDEIEIVDICDYH